MKPDFVTHPGCPKLPSVIRLRSTSLAVGILALSAFVVAQATGIIDVTPANGGGATASTAQSGPPSASLQVAGPTAEVQAATSALRATNTGRPNVPTLASGTGTVTIFEVLVLLLNAFLAAMLISFLMRRRHVR
jgi:hypothetical protein